MTRETGLRVAVALLVCIVAVGTLPGAAAAQSAPSGTVVIEEGETVSSVQTVAGTVVIRGTVTGDVAVAAGDVQIEGTVEGDVRVASGNLRIAGTVGGDVSAGAGNVILAEGARVGGNFEAGAGNVIIDGAVGGDATVGGEVIRLGEGASIGGTLRYDGTLQGNRDAVQGPIIRDQTIGGGLGPALQPLTSVLIAAYAAVINLVLGAVLLAVFPRFSAGVSERVRDGPLRTGAIGLGTLVAVPILLVALAVTIVGIPLAIVGALLFGAVAWAALVYGLFAVGGWLLSLAGYDSRWGALLLGVVGGAVLGAVPILGDLFTLVVFLLGLGAVARGLNAHRRRSSPPDEAATAASPPAE